MENIPGWVEKAAEKFVFSLKDVLAVVCDNASHVVTALRILGEVWNCPASMYHTLQLMDKDKDSKASMALEAARCTAELLKKSELASRKFKNKQKQRGTAQHKLIQGVPVRWNSSYYLVKHLLEQRWTVTATISDPEVTQKGKHYLGRKSDQLKLLERPKQVLKPFEQATVFLSSEAYVTVSALPPLAKVLQMPSQKTSLGSASVNSFQAAAT